VLAKRLMWIGPVVAVLAFATGLILGRFEFYDAPVHRALVTLGFGAAIVGLGAGVVALVAESKARKG
jgi:hypothetical protein